MPLLYPKRKNLAATGDATYITENVINQLKNDNIPVGGWTVMQYLTIPTGTNSYNINIKRIIVRPNPNPEATSVDGYVSHGDAGGLDWADLRNAAGTFSLSSGNALIVKIVSDAATDKWEELYRSIIIADIGSIVGGTITGITVRLKKAFTADTLSITPDINIYASAPASNTELAAGDYDSFGDTAFCDTPITYAAWAAGDWHEFKLNAAGLAAAQTAADGDGIFKIGLRNANYDVANSAPAWSYSVGAKSSQLSAYSADNLNEYAPQLVIDYTEEDLGSLWIEGSTIRAIDENGDEIIAIGQSLFNANTIIKADTDNTPEALTIAEQRIVGRITAGEITALTGAQVLTILTAQAGAAFDWNAQNLTNTGTITAGSSIWWHEYIISPSETSPGASGATFTPPGANTVGGYQLDVNTEFVYFWSHIEADWDAASDVVVEVFFEVNVNNTGGLVTDTVDLQLICRFKGDAETAVKTQTLEVANVVGQSAQYKQFETSFAIDYNSGTDPVQVGDIFGMSLNLETDTSEVDNIIINYIEFKYKTTKPAPEV